MADSGTAAGVVAATCSCTAAAAGGNTAGSVAWLTAAERLCTTVEGRAAVGVGIAAVTTALESAVLAAVASDTAASDCLLLSPRATCALSGTGQNVVCCRSEVTTFAQVNRNRKYGETCEG